VDFTLDALPKLVEFISLAHVGLKLKPKRPNAYVNTKCANPTEILHLQATILQNYCITGLRAVYMQVTVDACK
jgi:hypothetical protein